MPSTTGKWTALSCQATTKHGAPCRAVAAADGYCIAHDPRRHNEAQAARAKGGTVKNQLRTLAGRRKRLSTAAELIAFTSGVIQDVLSGDVQPEVARVCLYGISIQRQLVEVGDLERRLEALEAADTQQAKGSRGPGWGA